MRDLLVVDDLRIETRHGGRLLVDGVHLNVTAGRSRGLVGESGSGKSLTLRAVLGLLPVGTRVVGGSIRYDGVELARQKEAAWSDLRGAQIGYVGQDPALALDPLMSVGHQIREVSQRHGGGSRRAALALAEEWLDRVGIPDPAGALKRYPFELSGGQRQRVAIAMALAGSPRLLICDEPTTALDVTIQLRVLELLRNLVSQDGVSLLFVTHDLPVAAFITDDITVMRHGSVVEAGTTEQIINRPAAGYTRELIEASPQLPDADDVRDERFEGGA